MRAPFRTQLLTRGARPSASGFTLVELMVAMTGGLFLSIVVFALSRDASRFYQRESRIANATLAAVSGFDRLSSDVARAGHLSTPNIQADPHVCNAPQAAWPAQLRTLRSLIVETDTSNVTGTEVAAAGLTPQGIVVSGALSTPEVLITSAIAQNGAGVWQVDVDLTTPAAARLQLNSSGTAAAAVANLAVMTSMFMPGNVGRVIRLRNHGKDQYGVVAGVVTAAGSASITLQAAPALQRLVAGGEQCGIDDLGKGYALSIIDIVRYNLRSMIGNANYAAMYRASGNGSGGGAAVPFESGRVELVRVEVNPSGVEIASTLEIVGEYAVDLQFSATKAVSPQNPALEPVTGATITGSYAFTQLVRGAHLRFSVRSREADRDAPVTGLGSDLYRIPLGPSASAPYARLRTFQSDVPLRNFEGSNW